MNIIGGGILVYFHKANTDTSISYCSITVAAREQNKFNYIWLTGIKPHLLIQEPLSHSKTNPLMSPDHTNDFISSFQILSQTLNH